MQEWNKQRSEVIKFMLNNILYPEMTKEMKTLLLKEAKDGIREVKSKFGSSLSGEKTTNM